MSEIFKPTLRFPEFIGDWSSKRLGEICSTFKSGLGITATKIKDDGIYPVFGGNGLRGYTDTFTHDGFFVLIGRQGALCGNINRAYGKTYISEHAVAVAGDETSDTEWLAQKLAYMNLNQYSESSAQPGLAVNKLVKLKLKVPALLEQQKIAAFLTAVDDKIKQLTSKKKLLEKYKKGVSQKIFNREIRFKDDDGKYYPAWEEKKLGDIGELTSSKRVYLSDYVQSGIPFFRGKEISELKRNVFPKDILYITEKAYEIFKTKYGIPQTNDILITAVGTLGNVYRIPNDYKFYFKDGNLIWLKKINAESTFLEYLLEFNKPAIMKSAIGSTQKALTIVELKKISLHLPINHEQKKIAKFLTAVDDKINLVAKQIEQTQAFKKGLLQQMFI